MEQLPRTQYSQESVYFVKTENDVVVIGFLHQRRNPAAWQGP
jgi:hypothetical protein